MQDSRPVDPEEDADIVPSATNDAPDPALVAISFELGIALRSDHPIQQ